MISLAHKICVQILKMEAVCGNGSCCGYSTLRAQLKLYNTICTEFESFVFLVTGNLVYKCQFVCRDSLAHPARWIGLDARDPQQAINLVGSYINLCKS